jgi:ABC-type nitrate/sulfonate/bicarbonate transport system permease component
MGIPALLLAWWLIASILDRILPSAELILPNPIDVLIKDLPGFSTFYSRTGDVVASSYPLAFAVLAKHTVATLLRVFSGILIGTFLGVAVALLMGWSKVLQLMFNWPINMIRAVPTMALIPLFLLWFGGREIGNIIFVVFSVFVIIVVNAYEAIRNIPAVYAQFAATLGATRGAVYRKVIVPAIVPGITGGIRVALGSVWAIVLGAEYLAVDVGLGNLLILSKTFSQTGRMIVVVIVFGVFSILLNLVATKIIKKITKWMPEYT